MFSIKLFDKFPVFELGDITLRQLEEDDAEQYREYMCKAPVKEYLTSENIPQSYEIALDDIKYWRSLFVAKRAFYWGIVMSDNPTKLIGTAGYNMLRPIHFKGEISYDLDSEYWGKGIMQKSLATILSFGQKSLNLKRIQATVVCNNTKSISLLEKSWFQNEGRLKQFEIVNGKPADYFMYAKIY
jgi:[ribosomal protein S5]-alanine N-acetyltransferase